MINYYFNRLMCKILVIPRITFALFIIVSSLTACTPEQPKSQARTNLERDVVFTVNTQFVSDQNNEVNFKWLIPDNATAKLIDSSNNILSESTGNATYIHALSNTIEAKEYTFTLQIKQASYVIEKQLTLYQRAPWKADILKLPLEHASTALQIKSHVTENGDTQLYLLDESTKTCQYLRISATGQILSNKQLPCVGKLIDAVFISNTPYLVRMIAQKGLAFNHDQIQVQIINIESAAVKQTASVEIPMLRRIAFTTGLGGLYVSADQSVYLSFLAAQSLDKYSEKRVEIPKVTVIKYDPQLKQSWITQIDHANLQTTLTAPHAQTNGKVFVALSQNMNGSIREDDTQNVHLVTIDHELGKVINLTPYTSPSPHQVQYLYGTVDALMIVGQAKGSMTDTQSIQGMVTAWVIRTDLQGQEQWRESFALNQQSTLIYSAYDQIHQRLLFIGNTQLALPDQEHFGQTDIWFASLNTQERTSQGMQQIGSNTHDNAVHIVLDATGDYYLLIQAGGRLNLQFSEDVQSKTRIQNNPLLMVPFRKNGQFKFGSLS